MYVAILFVYFLFDTFMLYPYSDKLRLLMFVRIVVSCSTLGCIRICCQCLCYPNQLDCVPTNLETCYCRVLLLHYRLNSLSDDE